MLLFKASIKEHMMYQGKTLKEISSTSSSPVMDFRHTHSHTHTLQDTQAAASCPNLNGGVGAFVIPYPVLITEVTRPRRSDGCWFRRSLA